MNDLATISHSLWLQPMDVATVEVCIWIAVKTQVLESNYKVLQLNIKIVQCIQRDFAVSN